MKNKEELEKPICLKVKETEEELVKVVNEAKLPAFILKNIIEKIYNQLNEIELKEIKEYEEALKGVSENEKKK